MKWLDAQYLVVTFGPWAAYAIALIIFVETAFLITSFFPGDSLLFILGLTLADGGSLLPFPLAILLLLVMAFAGSQVGFEIGKRLGDSMLQEGTGLNRWTAWLLKPGVIKRAHELFETYGARAVILARFVPIIRALVPVLAGLAYLEREKFLRYNAVGAVCWVVGFTTAGYWFGQITWVQHNLEFSVLAVVLLTSLPLPAEAFRAWLKRRRNNR